MSLFSSFRSKLASWLSGQGRHRGDELTYHEMIADLLGQCPCCGGSLADHRLIMAASVSLQEGDELNRLRSLTERRDWESLAKLDEWNGITDNVILYALECSRNKVTLFELYSPFEICGKNRVLAVQVLSTEESRQFCQAVVRDWKTFREAIEADRAKVPDPQRMK